MLVRSRQAPGACRFVEFGLDALASAFRLAARPRRLPRLERALTSPCGYSSGGRKAVAQHLAHVSSLVMAQDAEWDGHYWSFACWNVSTGCARSFRATSYRCSNQCLLNQST